MGNKWAGVSDEKFLVAEKKVLGFSGIPEEEFEISNVVIDEDGNFIRTI